MNVGSSSQGGSSQPPPSMFQQMRQQGMDIDSYSKTLHIEGATVHIQKPMRNTVTLKDLEAMKASKKKG